MTGKKIIFKFILLFAPKRERELRETLSATRFSLTRLSHSPFCIRARRHRWASINMEISLMEKCTGESRARKRLAIKIASRETIVAARKK